MNFKVVFDMKYEHEQERSELIKHLWATIDKQSLTPSEVQEYANHLSKKHDTNANEKSTLKAGKSEANAQVYFFQEKG
ncbi:unnamed protein product [Adineta steineri]|uniref:Uncharacterized protein n=1 Tax=Adineta steineri TaxID=433720 RepID=A0A815HWT4_9BILA|nr:unnamed protein product [Adineta steineri]